MLDNISLARLQGVSAPLAQVVAQARLIVSQRYPAMWFRVTEGLRTEARQKELFEAQLTRTMNSRHLTGHAVDLGAFVGKEYITRLEAYYKLALCMREASMALNLPLRWGGCWQSLHALRDDEKALADAVVAYSLRVKRAGGKPLIDGPHFEIAA